MIAIEINDDGRVVAYANEGYHLDEELEIMVDPPLDFFDTCANDWLYVDGEWIYSPVEREEPVDMVQLLERENKMLDAKIGALEQIVDFYADCIAEMGQ